MHIAKLQKLVPTSFIYKYRDESGEEQSDKIELKIRRMSFSVVETHLQKLLIDPEKNLAAIADIIADTIAEWSIYMDAEETMMMPIEKDWFLSNECPYAFFYQLTQCVFDTLSVNPQKASNSVDGSAREPKPEIPVQRS